MSRGFSRLAISVLILGLCVGAAFAAGTVYGRTTSAKTLPSATATAVANGATGSGSGTGSRALAGSNGAAGQGTPAASTGALGRAGTGTGSGTGTGGTGGAGAFGGAGRGFAARLGGFSSGTIKAINGQTLTITTAAGTDETVNLAGTTKYGNVNTADKSALKVGGSVLISGTRDSSGNLQAASVVTLPADFAPGRAQ